jgi:ribosomal protein L40E
MKRLVDVVASVAGLAAVAGGIATAVSGGELEIALYVVGFVAVGTAAAGALASQVYDSVLLGLKKAPLIRTDQSDRELFWAFYIGFVVTIGTLIAWAAVDEDDLRRTAADMNALHWIGIVVIAIAALSAGLAIQPGRRPKTKVCPDCAGRVPVEARKCRHCGYRAGEPG